MKRSTADASLSLSPDLHPVNLLLWLAEVGYEFDDVWPVIDESWIEAIRARDWNRFAQPQQRDANTVDVLAQSEEAPDLGVGYEAGLLVEKLWRKGKWGNVYVSTESIQKMTHLDSRKIEAAIQELLRKGLLIEQERSGAYSLDSGKQHEIERIADLMVERSSHQ